MTRYLRTLVLGGDGRYPWTVKGLRDTGLCVKTWGVLGIKNEKELLQDALRGANLVLLPMMPFRGDVLEVAGQQVELGCLPGLLGENPLLLAGSFPEETENWLRNQGVRCGSLLEQEAYVLKNGAITAEGAIYLVLHHGVGTIQGAKVLVLGWGRIGKFLSEKLKALGAQVTVAQRRRENETILELLGYGTERIGVYRQGLGQYDMIFNTVPAPVMTERQFGEIRQDCLIVELASQPGGFPAVAAEKIIVGRGLPGKTAPRAAGLSLAEAVWTFLREGGDLE